MASGEEAKKQFSILDTGVQVDLPDHFCLERPENDKVMYLCCTPSFIFQCLNVRIEIMIFSSSFLPLISHIQELMILVQRSCGHISGGLQDKSQGKYQYILK